MKLIGLLVASLITLLLAYMLMVKKDPSEVTTPAGSATLGAPPPKDVAKNFKSAEQYTKSQTCLANCAAEDRTCSAMAMEPAAVSACAKTKSACEARCQ